MAKGQSRSVVETFRLRLPLEVAPRLCDEARRAP